MRSQGCVYSWCGCRDLEGRRRLGAGARSAGMPALTPYLGQILLADLSAAHVQAMFTATIRQHAAAGEQLSPATLVRVKATLRAALNAAIRAGHITTSAASQAELPPARRPRAVVRTAARIEEWQRSGIRPPVAVWTPAQTAAFLNSIRDHRLYAGYHLIALRGLRRGEACGLRWCDIDLDAATAVISWQLQQYDGHVTLCPPKTAHSERIIALDRTTVAVLRAHVVGQRSERAEAGDRYHDSGYVLTGLCGDPLGARPPVPLLPVSAGTRSTSRATRSATCLTSSVTERRRRAVRCRAASESRHKPCYVVRCRDQPMPAGTGWSIRADALGIGVEQELRGHRQATSLAPGRLGTGSGLAGPVAELCPVLNETRSSCRQSLCVTVRTGLGRRQKAAKARVPRTVPRRLPWRPRFRRWTGRTTMRTTMRCSPVPRFRCVCAGHEPLKVAK